MREKRGRCVTASVVGCASCPPVDAPAAAEPGKMSRFGGRCLIRNLSRADTHTHTHSYIHTHPHTQSYIHTHTPTHTPTYTHTPTHTHMHMSKKIVIKNEHTQAHTRCVS